MSTELLFHDDSYCREAIAEVRALTDAGIILDRTIFYPRGGGQDGDRGTITTAGGAVLAVTDTTYTPEDRTIVVHHVADPGGLKVGDKVTLAIDWPLRHRRMRAHTALHLLSAVLPFPVTGGQIGDGEGRLDFLLTEPVAEKEILSERLQALVDADLPVGTRRISEADLEAQPELVKTMSVKPPMGRGTVRLIHVESADLQPCGGTHVARTGEIGRLAIVAVENKGKQNKRFRLKLLDE
jgi:misacylated tRNA(Ala) deacylase